MEYIIIGICVVVVVIGIVVFMKRKTETASQLATKERTTLSGIIPKEDDVKELVIQIEMLPAEAIQMKANLRDYGQ